ncbi:hypothetical protein [Caloranaerobacter azorensis]|uniref:Uncharacterized protein n=3 Tax=Caloranaerobacter azorensis TaxID=116090 RepID=A0A1M5WHF4_9FIRM|nr:hypothetical protein [Caloranaerobacter azorensis]KGG81342.1 hypothetical protein Y919_00905 [Caloranaerobacter azorensis H53214]QIB26344.1 hypothetical protein G3A45_02860 [Caloranaerobacter azorensis]SHH86932.1 hypothetical protein SAMN02745135_02479 [Caloranaerobacter azorensis DSM 13643]
MLKSNKRKLIDLILLVFCLVILLGIKFLETSHHKNMTSNLQNNGLTQRVFLEEERFWGIKF